MTSLVFGKDTSGGGTSTGGTPQTATLSPGNELQYKQLTANVSYVICGKNADGGTIYVYNSSTGGSVKKSDQTSLTDCATKGT